MLNPPQFLVRVALKKEAGIFLHHSHYHYPYYHWPLTFGLLILAILYCWWQPEIRCENPLRLVVYPIIYRVLWVFPKIVGTPKSSILIGFSIKKPSILGYPYVWKHPYTSQVVGWPDFFTIIRYVTSPPKPHVLENYGARCWRWPSPKRQWDKQCGTHDVYPMYSRVINLIYPFISGHL